MKILLGCYKSADVVDPAIFMEAALAIMGEYPLDILKAICDPRSGLPSRLKWSPTLAEIKDACEMLMEPRRQYEDKLRRRAEQLDAGDAWNAPRTGPRRSADEILAAFEEVGFEFGSRKKRITVSRDEFVRRYGINEREFDALPPFR